MPVLVVRRVRAQVLPSLQPHVSVDVTTFFVVLFGLTALCFLATGCQNPGVPPLPEKPEGASQCKMGDVQTGWACGGSGENWSKCPEKIPWQSSHALHSACA